MSISLAVDFLLYGMLLFGLGVFGQTHDPYSGGAVAVTGLTGGAFCLIWGVMGLLKFRPRTGIILTLGVLSIALLVLAIPAWIAVANKGPNSKLIAIALSILWMFSIGQLANVLDETRWSRSKLQSGQQTNDPNPAPNSTDRVDQ